MQSDQQVQDFFTANSIEGALTPEQAAALLEGTPLQGDTVKPTEQPGGAPATTAAPTAAEPSPSPAAPAAPAPTPVVLAKDGQHTIPYETLVDARTEAQQARARAEQLQAELEALKAQPAAAAPAPAAIDIDAKEKEWLTAVSTGDDAAALALRREINAELLRQASVQSTQWLTEQQQLAQQQQLMSAAQAYAQSAKAAYPQLDNKSPQANADAIEFVLGKRNALMEGGVTPAEALQTAVEKAAALFGWKKGAAPAPAVPVVEPKAALAAAASAIAQAGETTPTTISDIPGARVDGRSPVEQLAAVGNGPDLVEAMANMTPDRIEQFLNRSI